MTKSQSILGYFCFKCRSLYTSLWISLVNLYNLLSKLSISFVVIIKINNSESWSLIIRFDDVPTHRSEMIYKFRSRVFRRVKEFDRNKQILCCSFGCSTWSVQLRVQFTLWFRAFPFGVSDMPWWTSFVAFYQNESCSLWIFFEFSLKFSLYQDNLVKFISYEIAV